MAGDVLCGGIKDGIYEISSYYVITEKRRKYGPPAVIFSYQIGKVHFEIRV